MLRDQELAGLAQVLGRDAGMKITVGGDHSYCATDGSYINIARMPATPLGRMLMTGLVFHEVGHKKYTTGGKPAGFLGDMMNVIEDIRTEMETIKERPGTCFDLEAVTSHYVKKGTLEPQDLNQALLAKVMGYGRGKVLQQKAALDLIPSAEEMMDDAFGQEFIDDVDKIIKKIPKLTSTKGTEKMAKELVDLLLQQKTPPPPPQPQPQQQQQQGQGQGEDSSQQQQGNGSAGQGEEEEDQQNGSSGANNEQEQDDQSEDGSSNSQSQSQEDGDQDDSSNGNGQSDPSGSDDQEGEEDSNDRKARTGGTTGGTGGGKRPSPEEIDEMLNKNSGYGDLSQLIQDELNQLAGAVPQAVKAGIPELPEIGMLPAEHGKLDEVEAISASSRMRAKTMGQLQSIKRQPVSFGSSGRKLSANRLVKMATGDPKIFKKKVEDVEINTAVTVLLDLSGSMDDKYYIANPAAFSLHNMLFGIRGVAVCSMEFSGKDYEPDVNILVDFGKKPLSEHFNHYPFDGTPTAEALWAARAKLLQRPEPRKIVLVLTDGCPNNGYETAAATARLQKDGIEIAAIGMKCDAVRQYWKNHQVIYSMQELPAAMFGVMEDLLTRKH